MTGGDTQCYMAYTLHGRTGVHFTLPSQAHDFTIVFPGSINAYAFAKWQLFSDGVICGIYGIFNSF